MIGEVFTIQHNINLHSEILDIPDFFSSADKKCMYMGGYVWMYIYIYDMCVYGRGFGVMIDAM